MEGVAVLRQLVEHFQELSETYYSPHFDPQRWYILDLIGKPIDDDFCSLVKGEKYNLVNMIEASPCPSLKRSRREKSRDKVLALTSCDMEQRIWKEFPEDLFEAVIAKLPVDAFFRFKAVCRKWNSLVTSNSFCQHVSEVPRSQPWFYTVTHVSIRSGVMYDSSNKKWHHQTIPFVPKWTRIFPVASAGGLVCFFDFKHRKFNVCNPLTNLFKELPPISDLVGSSATVGMTLNGKTANTGYKIVWLGSNGDHEVYDSVLNKWTHGGKIPLSIKLPLSLSTRTQSVSIGSTLYFMLPESDGIVSYDMANSIWKQLTIPLPPHIYDHTLAENGGKLMLVGLLSKNDVTCVCIWELQNMTLLWKEVDRMPNVWCLEFYSKHVHMVCLGSQGSLLLSLESPRKNLLVTYNMSSKEWQKVPDCVLALGERKQCPAYGISFYPCPTALA